MTYQDERREHINAGRPKPEKKKNWLNPVSEKRKTENEIYKERRLIFLAAHRWCECGRQGCNRKAVEIHHSKGKVGKNFLDESGWKAVARVCHRWAEENPVAAKESGVSQDRLV